MTPNTVWVQDKGLWVVSYVGPQVSGAISIGNSVLQIQAWEKLELKSESHVPVVGCKPKELNSLVLMNSGSSTTPS